MKYPSILEFIINRSDMLCTVQDIIDGKIPDEFLKKRNFISSFVFIHKQTMDVLVPMRIESYSKLEKNNDFNPRTHFYDVVVADDVSAIVRNSEEMIHRILDYKKIKGIDFNKAQEKGDILEPLFFKIEAFEERNKVTRSHDDFDQINAYFINPMDYERHQKFLEEVIGNYL